MILVLNDLNAECHSTLNIQHSTLNMFPLTVVQGALSHDARAEEC